MNLGYADEEVVHACDVEVILHGCQNLDPLNLERVQLLLSVLVVDLVIRVWGVVCWAGVAERRLTAFASASATSCGG